ncbi:venom protease-like [Panulirus ornatus]|uniref:venom protease-like n=1 Tax=Panulirus ornatus TaxID=150431 RepID=UPI003A868F43
MKWLCVGFLFLTTVYAQIRFPEKDSTISLPPVPPEIVEKVDKELSSILEVSNRQNINTANSPTCVTPAGESGTCGPLRDCRGYFPLLRQIRERAITSFFRERVCRVLPSSLHVCCPNGRPILPSGFEQSPGTPGPSQPSTSIIPSENTCGVPLGGKIVNGIEVYPGRWPWLAAVGFKTSDVRFFASCGGSLITVRHVLTAAHCFDNRGQPDPTDVRLGEHNLVHSDDGAETQDFSIKTRVGNGYNRNTNENDIMLLTLDHDAQYNNFVKPICLPFNEQNNDFVGQTLTVIGWGRTAFENRRTSDVPMQVGVPVVDTQRCKIAFTRLRKRPVVDNRNICAGIGTKDSCNGDSGGPLNYLGSNGRYYLAGIVSFGVECARADFPGVYTRVSHFLDWIERNVQ